MTGPSAQKATHVHSEQARRLTLNERLALMNLISEGARKGSVDSPLVADIFSDLWELVDSTVSGAKVDRLKQDAANGGFKVLEVNAETGENLGRLNMLYLNKPIPCYYLVYVEVAAPFRNKGLGNMVLKSFRDFLVEKNAVGILDNIIPPDDPTYDIYAKLEWMPAEAVIGTPWEGNGGFYMIFVPPSMAGRDLGDPVRKLLHHLKRKRAAIEMRDNEVMVQRTIEEFKDLYSSLLTYFRDEIGTAEPSAFMQFVFTRFVTKLLGFRRRIGQLLGYTGGESLQQIVLAPEIRALPVKSYAPKELADKPSFVTGDRELWLHLPEPLKKHPARLIESLPNYRRPSLVAWLEEQGRCSSDTLTIGDLLDLGFDPTRLKEITLDNEEYIFERLQARMLGQLEDKKALLERIAPEMQGVRIRNGRFLANPPLLVVRDRGNAYVLRRKVEGIHWEEAVDQLQSCPALKSLNQSLAADRMVVAAVRDAANWLKSRLEKDEEGFPDQATYFVAWDLDNNWPRISVDVCGSFVETIWIA